MEGVRIPSETGTGRDWILKYGLRGYSLRTSRSVNGDTTQVLERESGDFILIIHLKGLIINQPGIVAAVGGIPEQLKLDGGISFRFPCPFFKVPNNLPRDPNARHKALLEAYEKSSSKTAFKQGFVRAYKQAQGLSLSSEEELMEEQEKLHVSLVEVNLAAPLDPCGLYLNPESIPTHPIPIKQAPVESEFVKHQYFIVTCEEPGCGTIRILGRSYGDHLEVTFLKGVVSVGPGYVSAAGGIPRHLRLHDGMSFWYRCPILKGLKIQTQDPGGLTKYSHTQSVEANRKSLSEAYTKALRRFKQSKDEEHGIKQSKEEEEEQGFDTEPCIMVEVNITHPEGTQYFEATKNFRL